MENSTRGSYPPTPLGVLTKKSWKNMVLYALKLKCIFNTTFFYFIFIFGKWAGPDSNKCGIFYTFIFYFFTGSQFWGNSFLHFTLPPFPMCPDCALWRPHRQVIIVMCDCDIFLLTLFSPRAPSSEPVPLVTPSNPSQLKRRPSSHQGTSHSVQCRLVQYLLSTHVVVCLITV